MNDDQIKILKSHIDGLQKVLADSSNKLTAEQVHDYNSRIGLYLSEIERLSQPQKWQEKIRDFVLNLDLSKIVAEESDAGKWKFDVEESEHLSEFGFVVLKNNRRKFFMRPRKLSEKEIKELEKLGMNPEGYELLPISTAEMREKGIQETTIEESENFVQENEDIEIEE